jgi:hypothetical protein
MPIATAGYKLPFSRFALLDRQTPTTPKISKARAGTQANKNNASEIPKFLLQVAASAPPSILAKSQKIELIKAITKWRATTIIDKIRKKILLRIAYQNDLVRDTSPRQWVRKSLAPMSFLKEITYTPLCFAQNRLFHTMDFFN